MVNYAPACKHVNIWSIVSSQTCFMLGHLNIYMFGLSVSMAQLSFIFLDLLKLAVIIAFNGDFAMVM